MLDIPITRYRPTRTSDGKGGFNEALGLAYDCFAEVTVHDGVIVMLIDRDEDVRVGDFIHVADEQDSAVGSYRITAWMQGSGGDLRKATLERVTRPIVPTAPRAVYFGGLRVFYNGSQVKRA